MASGGFDMAFGDFRPNSGGIIEVFTGGGMQGALADAASQMCGAANAAAHLSHAREAPEYASGVDVLDRTAVGYVTTGNVEAMVDQAKHHTLDGVNH